MHSWNGLRRLLELLPSSLGKWASVCLVPGPRRSGSRSPPRLALSQTTLPLAHFPLLVGQPQLPDPSPLSLGLSLDRTVWHGLGSWRSLPPLRAGLLAPLTAGGCVGWGGRQCCRAWLLTAKDSFISPAPQAQLSACSSRPPMSASLGRGLGPTESWVWVARPSPSALVSEEGA